jgi:hypothetical protein
MIQQGIREFSDMLEAGLDYEEWPASYKLRRLPRGIQIAVVCSAVRRLDARDIAVNLALVAQEFQRFVRALQLVQAVGS